MLRTSIRAFLTNLNAIILRLQYKNVINKNTIIDTNDCIFMIVSFIIIQKYYIVNT